MHWSAWSKDNVPMSQVHDNIQLTPKVEQEDEYESCGSKLRSSLVDPSPKPSARQNYSCISRVRSSSVPAPCF